MQMHTYLFRLPGMQIWRRHESDDEAMSAARELARKLAKRIEVRREKGDREAGTVGVAEAAGGAG
jgi:hypothetical protein